MNSKKKLKSVLINNQLELLSAFNCIIQQNKPFKTFRLIQPEMQR